MTSQTLPREQRVPIPADQDRAAGVGVHVGPSPLAEMTTLQVAIEDAKERIEETRICQPISPDVAERIVGWAAEDSIDWDLLIASDRGWGIAEP